MKINFEKNHKKKDKIGIIDLKAMVREYGLDNVADNLQSIFLSEHIIRSIISDICSLGILDLELAKELDFYIIRYFEKYYEE